MNILIEQESYYKIHENILANLFKHDGVLMYRSRFTLNRLYNSVDDEATFQLDLWISTNMFNFFFSAQKKARNYNPKEL